MQFCSFWMYIWRILYIINVSRTTSGVFLCWFQKHSNWQSGPRCALTISGFIIFGIQWLCIDQAVYQFSLKFLVGAFLKERVGYSHGFPSVFFYFFFDTLEVTKIVLPKVLQNFEKTPNCTCWPKELNQKGFPRNIQYRRRLKGPPFQFFRHCETFFIKGFQFTNTLTFWSPFAIFEP